MATLRAFVALEISDRVRTQIGKLIARLATTPAQVKWVEPENLHWTLKFLGDVEMRETAALCRRMTDVAASFEPIEITVARLDAFPDRARPRTIWLGAESGGEAMSALYDALEISFAEMGFSRERRRFTPHLTIGRVRGGRDLDELSARLTQHVDFRGDEMLADEIVLFSSEMQKNGPRYEAIGRAPLVGG